MFVSYSHDDKAAVEQEITALAGRGIRVYYDEGIYPGHAWHEDLAHAIETCSLFLMFVTPRSVASRNCQRELAFALDRDRTVLPVLLQHIELPSSIRLQIGNRQAIIRPQFTETEFRDRLAGAVFDCVNGVTDAPAAVPVQLDGPRRKRNVRPAIVVSAVVAVLATALVVLIRDRYEQTERTQALGEISKLVSQDRYAAAFRLARPLVESSGTDTDPALHELWRQIVVPIAPMVSQTGATVYFRPYEETDGEWLEAGSTPVAKPIDAPRGVLRLKIEKPGFRTSYVAVANPGPLLQAADALSAIMGEAVPATPSIELVADGALGDDMVLVPRSNIPVLLSGWSSAFMGDHPYDIPAFAIGRTEVTNRDFKAFVDAGGYDNPSYWQGLEFAEAGRKLTFVEARAQFVDATGRAGPAGWQLGSFSTGTGDLPVGGISWYEAVAYARFKGQALPTVHHWLRAAFAPLEGGFPTAPAVANSSRFSASGPAAANADKGLGPWGTLNAAGNVREWVWNFVGDEALALGGAWPDYPATYSITYTTPPMHRSPEYGMRLMHVLADAPLDAELLAPIQLSFDSPVASREPVSDDAFAAMRFQFTATHRTPTSVEIEQIAQTDAWVADEVQLRFANAEPFTLYIVRSRDHRGPLQPIVYGPAGDAAGSAKPNRAILDQMSVADFVVNGRRALVWPIWAHTYQRFESMANDADGRAEQERRAPVAWHQDLVTTLDYLATRNDIDAQRIGYFGFSFGSEFIAPPLLAIEGRLKAAALIDAGLWNANSLHPMYDGINYLPRITTPILVVNGRYDTILPFESSQKRFFDLLGTAPNDKRFVSYDVAHMAALGNEGKREVADWFDRYLGTVR
ncbi:MAG TPA: SUMF1/EgtB/PvdO family nonheme iron enzyme [Pseudomonadales bacterium]|nr:SUMF1/EgtB/PvdO family nonheme iron enzyme [Pseudomonadales bacterium]